MIALIAVLITAATEVAPSSARPDLRPPRDPVVQTTPKAKPQPPAKPIRKPGPPPRLVKFSLGFGVGASATKSDFDQDVRFTLFAEEARITGPVSVSRGPRIDVHAGYRIWRHFGAGVSLSRLQTSGPMLATFSLPHPFLVGALRDVSGEGDAKRTTTDLHLRGLIGVKAGPVWHIVAFGGPSVSFLQQQLGHDRFNFVYEFPFTTVTLEANDEVSSGRGIGAHAGVSITRLIGRRWGLLGEIRASTTRVEVDTLGTPTEIQTGGVHLGVGLRFHF